MQPPSLGSVNWGDVGTWKMYYTRKFEDSGGVFHAKPHEMICDLEDIWQIIETFLYDFLPKVHTNFGI